MVQNRVLMLLVLVLITSGCMSNNNTEEVYELDRAVLTSDAINSTDFYQGSMSVEDVYIIEDQESGTLDSEDVSFVAGKSFIADLLRQEEDTFDQIPNAIISAEYEIESREAFRSEINNHIEDVENRSYREIRSISRDGKIVIKDSELDSEGDVERYIVDVFHSEGDTAYQLTIIDFEEEPTKAWRELAKIKDKSLNSN